MPRKRPAKRKIGPTVIRTLIDVKTGRVLGRHTTARGRDHVADWLAQVRGIERRTFRNSEERVPKACAACGAKGQLARYRPVGTKKGLWTFACDRECYERTRPESPADTTEPGVP